MTGDRAAVGHLRSRPSARATKAARTASRFDWSLRRSTKASSTRPSGADLGPESARRTVLGVIAAAGVLALLACAFGPLAHTAAFYALSVAAQVAVTAVAVIAATAATVGRGTDLDRGLPRQGTAEAGGAPISRRGRRW